MKVDRSTKWGNPFIVAQHGGRVQCVHMHGALLGGYLCLSTDNVKEQQDYLRMATECIGELRGKNLACWCPLDQPCHADALLGGYLCLSTDNVKEQQDYLRMATECIGELRGKNLACWCPLDQPCHADALLVIANWKRKEQG